MTLGELISYLNEYVPSARLARGITEPRSFRGSYENLAFKESGQTTYGACLVAARSALDQDYTGYKGGEFRMHENVECYLVDWRDCGDPLTKDFFDLAVSDLISSEMQVEIDKLKADMSIKQSEIDRLRVRVDELDMELKVNRAALTEACASIQSWGQYAGEYFQDKWDLKGDCDPENHLLSARKALETSQP